MEIVINPLDPESIKNAIEQIEAYKNSFPVKQETMITDAVRTATDKANQVYAQHPGDHGTASAYYDIDPKVNSVEATITATAPASEIGFIEFGTGKHHPEWDSSQVPYKPPKHGSYGLGQGDNPGWWYYGGWMTDGRDPASAMLVARQTLIESVLDNAREVFRS